MSNSSGSEIFLMEGEVHWNVRKAQVRRNTNVNFKDLELGEEISEWLAS